MLRLILAAGAAGLLATAATAQTDPPPAAEPADNQAAEDAAALRDSGYDPLKIVCRKVRPPTGTRIVSGQTRQSMCMSNADWEQQELDAQEALRVRDEGTCGPGKCGG